jgi:2-polyprenyl-3-methyl-5-hydroxy-6-metoxy-1,4-benzoquinol methylase
MAERTPTRHGPDLRAPAGVVWSVLAEWLAARPSRSVEVVDVGGGTGGFAVPLARLGHRVTVVDPSPDALASLERRAGDAGVQVRAVQGDAAGLLDVVPAAAADLVLCHGVLEHVDDPAAAVAAQARALRPAGALSLLAANRHAAVLSRAVAGHFAEARHVLDDPAGRSGRSDPVQRRFAEAELLALLADAGVPALAVHGVRTFTDLVPGALAETDDGEVLAGLEEATAERPEFRAVAGQLHLLGVRS